MTDWNKYIGVSYKEHGRDLKTGVDCFGLVINVLKNEFNISLSDWMENEEEFNKFKKVDEPEIGSIGLFKFIGVPVHVGVYIGDGRLLHVAPGEMTVAEKIESRRLKDRVCGWYNAG